MDRGDVVLILSGDHSRLRGDKVIDADVMRALGFPGTISAGQVDALEDALEPFGMGIMFIEPEDAPPAHRLFCSRKKGVEAMARKVVRELVSYEVVAADFPELRGVLGPRGSVELPGREYDDLKEFSEGGVLAVVLSDSWQYGRNGGAYIACICADTSGGRRSRTTDSVDRILSRCRELDRRVSMTDDTFDLESRLLVELAQRGRLKEVRNFRFEMKATIPGAGGGELRTISAESRKQAERIYWAWSSFKNKPNPDGTYNSSGGSGCKYILTVTDV